MRTVARELSTLSTVLAIPLAIAVVFPYSALSFKARSVKPHQAFHAAFVTLSAAQEKSALETAKTSWQGGIALGMRRIHAELSPSALPDDPLGEVMPKLESGMASSPPLVRYELSVLPPEHAAPAPIKLEPERVAPKSFAFPKAELLKID